MAKLTVDITSTQTPSTDTKFSEQKVNTISGPTPVLKAGTSLESNALPKIKPQMAAIWNPLTTFEEGLKTALIEFIDTTMEGVKYNKSFNGRSKQIDFFYYGTSTKSVRPSEIGHFKLIFSYPPNVTQPATFNTTSLA
jgi:hypothetical protein